MYHNSKIKMAVTVILCICMCVWSRFQRKVAAQPVEAGDQQSCDVWPAHPVSYVHKQNSPECLGGGPETTAQVRNKRDTFISHCPITATVDL